MKFGESSDAEKAEDFSVVWREGIVRGGQGNRKLVFKPWGDGDGNLIEAPFARPQ